MKKFDKVIQESSLARVASHTKQRNIGLISASRGDLPSSENKKRHTELKKDIRKAGYGFIRVKGRYIENHGKPNARNVDEHSLLIIGHKGDDKGHLLGHLKHLGQKYGQDSILHKPHNSNEASLHGTNKTGYPGQGKSVSVGKWHPNRAGEFHSLLKNRKPFAFGEDFEYIFVNDIGFFSRKEQLY